MVCASPGNVSCVASADRVLAVLGRGLVDPGSPLLCPDDRAVLLGESAFETIMVVNNKAVLLAEHLQRLSRSAASLEIEVPSVADLTALVEQAIIAFSADHGSLRLVITPGPADGTGVAYALLSPVPPQHGDLRRTGIRAVTLPLGVPAGLRAAAPWLLGGVKSGSYAVSAAAVREAERRGADDAIWVSSDGEVLEGTKSAIAWVHAGQLITVPAVEVGVLPSVTWEIVARLAKDLGLSTATRRARVDEVRGADEVMLLSSIRGIAPVISLDDRPVADGVPGPITRTLQKALSTWLENPT